MSITMDDLVGLNATPMRDQVPLLARQDALRLREATPDASLVAAGARHAQGGHFFVEGGRLLDTLAGLNRIGAPQPVAGQRHLASVAVEAGATWEEIHRVVGPYGYAPMVQQSSAGFSVGGSISVNCHGRDPRWGPLSSTVEDLTVLTGTGQVITASRQFEPELFRAVLGGYGACGLVLAATLRLVANSTLEYVGDVFRRDVDDYVLHVKRLAGRPEVHLHYAWLCCVRGRFYEECLIADLKARTPEAQPVAQRSFLEEPWGEGEILRAGWSAARHDMDIRLKVWEQLRELHQVNLAGRKGGKGTAAGRIEWLRASVGFTGARRDGSADVLQEFFVPPDALPVFLRELKTEYARAGGQVNVLSTTLRVVQHDEDDTVLSYCAGGLRVCVAVDAEVATVGTGTERKIDPRARHCFAAAVTAARACGGTYYLPYAGMVYPDVMRAVYGERAGQRLQAAIDRWNPRQGGRHRFWNRFLDAHFA